MESKFIKMFLLSYFNFWMNILKAYAVTFGQVIDFQNFNFFYCKDISQIDKDYSTYS